MFFFAFTERVMKIRHKNAHRRWLLSICSSTRFAYATNDRHVRRWITTILKANTFCCDNLGPTQRVGENSNATGDIIRSNTLIMTASCADGRRTTLFSTTIHRFRLGSSYYIHISPIHSNYIPFLYSIFPFLFLFLFPFLLYPYRSIWRGKLNRNLNLRGATPSIFLRG